MTSEPDVESAGSEVLGYPLRRQGLHDSTQLPGLVLSPYPNHQAMAWTGTLVIGGLILGLCIQYVHKCA